MEPSSPPEAPPLSLPPAFLHDTRPDPPHPDSVEFLQNDRFRTAEELSSLPVPSSASDHPLASNTTHPAGSSPRILRSRGSSSYRRGLPSRCSQISTALDDNASRNEWRHQLRRQKPRWWDPVSRMWKREVSVTIDEGSHRDHLELIDVVALERTFLGYLRTSLAFAITGVLIAQLFRLQHSLNPNAHYGFFVLGIPLAVVFLFAAMIVLALGAFRFWSQQRALIRGKVRAGGWEIVAIMALSVVVSALLGFFLVFG